MIKHFGPIVMWVIVAGVALYVVRHYGNLIDGVFVLQEYFGEGGAFDRLFDLQ